MKLIKPKIELKDKFYEVIEDYKREQEWHYYYKYDKALEDYDGYLTDLEKNSKGIDLAEGDVPTTLYWLVDEGETEIRGIIRIRHKAVPIHGNIGYDVPPKMRFKGYGREILKLGVLKAKEMGITEVRVTCAANNEGSKRIIEANGGELLGTAMDNSERFNQYLIK